MKINIKNHFLYIKNHFFSPSFAIEVSNITEFGIFVKDNDVLSIGFKIKDATQYINCDDIAKNDFLNMVNFIEKNLDIPRKIYLDEDDVTHKFDKIEEVYALTRMGKLKYSTRDKLDLILFGSIVIFLLASHWLNPFLNTVIFSTLFIMIFFSWLIDIGLFIERIRNWFTI
jgi:hypothetical protein